MSDDEAFLEFKLGEEPANPWNSSRPKTPEPKPETTFTEIPATPTHVRTKFSPTRLADQQLNEVRTPENMAHLRLDFAEEPTHEPIRQESPAGTAAGPASEPASEPVGKPVGDPVAKPVAKPVAEPVAEPVGDPVGELVAEPVGEPIPESPSVGEPERSSVSGLGISTRGTPDKGPFTASPSILRSPRDNTPASPTDSPRSVKFSESPAPQHSQQQQQQQQQSQSSERQNMHSRSSSHIEYHQGPMGDIEKLHVSDETGLPVEETKEDEDSWEQMATVGSYEIYDDKNNLVVEKYVEDESIGGQNAAASGYTRVANNDDAASITSLDDKTDFLFDAHKPTDDIDADFQMAATKSMLKDQQKIAYAGLCRLALAEMANKYRNYGGSSKAVESLQKWGTKFILRLYNHLGLDNEEQLMIESLAAHNLLAEDLTPCLKQIQKVTEDGAIVKEVVTEPAADDDGDDDDDDTGAKGGRSGDTKKQPEHQVTEVNVDDLHEDLPTTQEIDKSLEIDVKWTVMCDLFLILLADGEYDARARTLMVLTANKLGVTSNEVSQFERKVTEVLQIDDNADQDWTEEDIIEARRRRALRKKYAYVGLATVGGGLVIGLSGGLLAPLVGVGLAGALGTIGITGTGTFLAGVGGTAIITTASTAIGAHVGSKAMLKRTGHIKTFEFRPIFNNNRVNLVITVSGWMTGKEDDVRLPFSTIDPVVGDVMSILWEPEIMRSLGQTINIIATEALAFGVQQILAATIFSVLMAALTAPMWLAKLSYLVDNPWSVSQDRAWSAGLILADTLMQRKLGSRPVTLVGYSLGARVIYSCIYELSRKNAFGLVQDVYLFGTPVFYNKKSFAQARSVVSGRYVNGYSKKDWILAFLFPAAKRYGMVLGLDPVPEAESELLDIENVDVSDVIEGHMNYRAKMPKILKMVGWPVLSEEFDEIEDPDPEHTREKQLKLLHELDTAEPKPKKGIFSNWGFDWMQRAKSKPAPAKRDATIPGGNGGEGQMLFDIDAIRSEMESLKPRMVFEQEEMPLPERDQTNMPMELMQDPEPVAPSVALDYDDPASPKPVGTPHSGVRKDKETKPDSKQPQLQFDDLE